MLTESSPPRHQKLCWPSTARSSDASTMMNAARGAVTINLAIRQDLSLPTKAQENMENVKAAVR